MFPHLTTESLMLAKHHAPPTAPTPPSSLAKPRAIPRINLHLSHRHHLPMPPSSRIHPADAPPLPLPQHIHPPSLTGHQSTSATRSRPLLRPPPQAPPAA